MRQVKRSRTERLASENSQYSSKMNANYVTKAEREKEVKEKKRKPARTKKKHNQSGRTDTLRKKI